jgi:hypothetical protein
LSQIFDWPASTPKADAFQANWCVALSLQNHQHESILAAVGRRFTGPYRWLRVNPPYRWNTREKWRTLASALCMYAAPAPQALAPLADLECLAQGLRPPPAEASLGSPDHVMVSRALLPTRQANSRSRVPKGPDGSSGVPMAQNKEHPLLRPYCS